MAGHTLMTMSLPSNGERGERAVKAVNAVKGRKAHSKEATRKLALPEQAQLSPEGCPWLSMVQTFRKTFRKLRRFGA